MTNLAFGRELLVLIILTGLLFLFFLVLPVAGGDVSARAEMLARIQMALRSTAQVAGILLALIACAALARAALEGREVGNLVTCGVALLGGVLLFEQHWLVVLVFGLLVLAQVARAIVERRWGVALDQFEVVQTESRSPGARAAAEDAAPQG